MQIVKYSVEDKALIVGFKENDFVVYTTIEFEEHLSKQELLQKAYLQVRETIKFERTQTEHSFTTDLTGEEFIPQESQVEKMYVDFNNLTGQVVDQYGNVISKEIIFTVEGTNKAKIKNNKIVEDEVEKDTEYYIIAKYKDLEKRQKRIIYCTKIVEERIDPEKIVIAEAIVDLNNRVQKLEGGN
ncbi:hypothetical protein H1057_18035 [Clostridium sporogenes]|uniref:hypothetical protein n=1 Tax=Clostridium sporogenes TaxID=1509 RepID=UPI0015EEC291|nr:hypothetical protein [Clostridium sporogenes]MBA4509920.1 hypothetical protein [Clostridium sporogenes]